MAALTDAQKLLFLPATEISRLVCARELSAREVVDAAYACADASDAQVRAYNQRSTELAYAAADTLDSALAAGATPGDGLPDSGLVGAPVAFKDNMNLLGTRTTCSSRILSNYESVYDCTAARRLLDAGTLPLGKLNMDEFAFGSSTENSAFGPTHNPWDLTRVPGGSSGGSAAAVAAGMASLTLGSDTGGSIRQPGACCGVVALKPTYGRVSRYGCVAFASSLDQIGPFAHTVRDTALALGAISGKDRYDATSVDAPVPNYVASLGADLKGLRVAVATDFLELDGLDREVKAGVLDAARRLTALGAEVGETTLPSTEYGLSAYYIVGPAEASGNLARFDGIRYGVRASDATDVLDLYMRSRAEGFGPETIRRVMIGTYVLSAGYYDAYYMQAQKARTVIKQDFDRVFADFDLVLTPTAPTPAFKLGEKTANPLSMYLSDIFTIPVNLAGNAALHLPTKLSEAGLPLGVQLIANHFDEASLFRAAYALEQDYQFPYADVTVASEV